MKDYVAIIMNSNGVSFKSLKAEDSDSALAEALEKYDESFVYIADETDLYNLKQDLSDIINSI